MTIEPNKFYKTRSGLKARIYAVDGGEGKNIAHGAILYDWGWAQDLWYSNGSFLSLHTDDKDLVSEWTEPKPKLKAWLGELNTKERLTIVHFSESEEPPLEMDRNWKRAEWLDEK